MLKVKPNKATRTKKVWDNYKIVAEVKKSERLKFVFAAGTLNGFRYINIREFYLRKSDGVWRPGRDGINLPLLSPLRESLKDGGELQTITPAEDFARAFATAMDYVSDMELADPDNEVWLMYDALTNKCIGSGKLVDGEVQLIED